MVWIEFDNNASHEEVGVVKVARFFIEYDRSSKCNLALITYSPITYKFPQSVRIDGQGNAVINCSYIRSMFPSDQQFKKSGHNKTDILTLLKSSDKDAVKLGFAIIETILNK